MSFLDVLRDALLGRRSEPWDAEKDKTVMYLRYQKATAEHETARLRRERGDRTRQLTVERLYGIDRER